MSSLQVSHWSCAVPKAGGDEADSEDAAAVSTERWPVCAAVADGATESIFSGAWAGRLVEGMVEIRATTTHAFGDALSDWQAEWREAVRLRTQERPWYVAAKATEGAFAAVLGLSLHADGRWRALSVGDCCLFHVRDGDLLESWPYEAPDAFTNRPALVPSRPDREETAPETTTGTWRPTDRFVLATDAVAAWLMRDRSPSVARLNEEEVPGTLEAARADGLLRNDDTTLLVLDLTALPEAGETPSGCS